MSFVSVALGFRKGGLGTHTSRVGAMPSPSTSRLILTSAALGPELDHRGSKSVTMGQVTQGRLVCYWCHRALLSVVILRFVYGVLLSTGASA